MHDSTPTVANRQSPPLKTVREHWPEIHPLVAWTIRRLLRFKVTPADLEESVQETLCLAFHLALTSEARGGGLIEYPVRLAMDAVCAFRRGQRFSGLGSGKRSRVDDALPDALPMGALVGSLPRRSREMSIDLRLDLTQFFRTRPQMESEIALALAAGETLREVGIQLGRTESGIHKRREAMRAHWEAFNRERVLTLGSGFKRDHV